MPTTTNKLYSVQTAGSNAGTWGAGNPGSDLNTGVIGVIDSNMAGVYSASLSSSNVSLSQSDVQNCLYRFTGTLLASVVVSPAGGVTMAGFFYWENYTSGNFTVTLTTGAGSVVLPQSRGGVVFIDGTNGPRILAIVGKTNADPIPVGTVMTFYQNAAPTGWTISSSLDDYGIKIVSSAGGVTTGTTAYSAVFGQTETGSHALTTAEIPSHTHPLPDTPNGSGQTGPATGGGYGSYSFNGTGVSSATGGGNGHSHPISLSVRTASMIMATKN